MTSLIERAANLLFPTDGQQTLNIKFFSAGDDNITAADLAEQVIRAESQIRNGSARLMADIDSQLTPAV